MENERLLSLPEQHFCTFFIELLYEKKFPLKLQKVFYRGYIRPAITHGN